MEVILPMASTSPDFFFSKTTTTTPCPSAPSSPKPFGNPNDFFYAYASAPTSPSHASSMHSNDFNFPSSLEASHQEDAQELFHNGQIRPFTKPHGQSPRISCFTTEEAKSDSSSKPLNKTRSSSNGKSGGSRKWRLKDLFLFRSASEGRATGRGSKDPLKKYTLLPSFSFSADHKEGRVKGLKSEDGSNSMKLHYVANRAASEEQKKRVPLPYHRNTLFGCLHFNPAVKSIARGFGNNNS